MCPSDDPTIMPFEICVINADGTNKVQLTNNTVNDLGPNWSPDGQHIVFNRPVGGGRNQLFVINLDDIDPNDPADPDRLGTQITGVRPDDEPQGWNGLVAWDLLRVRVDK
jgi:Tol biopolymer transport system component